MANINDCDLSYATVLIQQISYFIAYYIFMPIYFILGISGNTVLLLAFYKQAKSEKAYAYQVFLTSSKILEIFFTTLFWWGYKWNAGVEWAGHSWYMNNYGLMFYSAHIGCPLANGFIITSLLFSVAMTSDRVFALTKPFLYKSINQRRHQIVAVIACVFIGLSTSAFEVKRWTLFENNSTNSGILYSIQYDFEYVYTPVAMVLANTRTAVRLIGVISLILLNIMMIIAFRKRSRQVSQMISEKKDQERRNADKTLLTLTIYQSALMCLSQLPHSGYFMATFLSSSFGRCYGVVVAPFVDSCIQIADSIDFFIIICVNRRMKQAVFDAIIWWKKPPLKDVVEKAIEKRYLTIGLEWIKRHLPMVPKKEQVVIHM